ncbi:NAD(P)-dependent alcohol dehydrogenase [Actinopolymorpha pittospori]
MKAIVQDVYGSADVLQLRDIDKPVIGDRDVLVRVRAAGVDPSVWHLMSGSPYLVRVMGFGLRRPNHPVRGWDVAGTVEAVGGQVTQLKPGDDVFGSCDGSFAEYARAAESKVVTKPANLSFEQAAALPTSAVTAVQALRDKGRLVAGQHVLVIGAAGGVGTFAVQIAAAMGAKVTGVCRTTKMDLVRSIGAHDVIDYTREDFTDGTRRFDLILDTGGNRPLTALRRALTPTGTLVLVGGEGGGPLLAGMQRNLGAGLLTLLGKQRLVGMFATVRSADLEYLRKLVVAGDLSPVIDRTFPLPEAPEAVRYLQHGQTRGGKVVITV